MSTVESEESSPKFTPREPRQIQHQALSKTVFTHIVNLHSALATWGVNRIEGFQVARLVRNLNLPECEDDYTPSQMEPLMDRLVASWRKLRCQVEEIKIIKNQLQALAILQSSYEPVLMTWSVKQISEKAIDMYENAQRELDLLEKVTENIGHCRDANMLAVYLESWRPGTYVRLDNYTYLFSEALLPPVGRPT